MPEFRPSSYPYVSGDAFRSYADYAFDELDSSLNPETMKPYSTLFVKTDFLGEFCEKIAGRIAVPYILITHNSDDSAPGPHTAILDNDNLIAWFTLNYDGYAHPKLHALPIGLANFCWAHGNIHTFKKAHEAAHTKDHLAYMNFTIQTFYAERWPVFRLFSNVPFCYRTIKKPFAGYLVDLAASDFSISPRGFGLDTHRLWESLYLHTIPIVRSSSLDSLYEGLEVLIIDKWEVVNEEFLKQKKIEFSQKTFRRDKLEMDYWIKLINSFKTTPTGK
jgi:hypothetical protein